MAGVITMVIREIVVISSDHRLDILEITITCLILGKFTILEKYTQYTPQ